MSLSISLSLKYHATGINVPLPRALDAALNAIIPSELLFLDVEAIVAEIVQWDSINTSVFEIVKIISIIQSIIDIAYCI